MATLARLHGLPEPSFFEDNGCRRTDEKPALSCLLELIAAGAFRTVLIPALFVFGDGPGGIPSILGKMATAGCEIIELPRSDL